MPRRNASRARRRNADRNRKNLLALAAAVEVAAEPPKRRNARFQRVLERLRNRSSITLHQFQAGDRLYRDYLASGSQLGCLTMRWEPPTRADAWRSGYARLGCRPRTVRGGPARSRTRAGPYSHARVRHG
jgi:hypothetical protein